MKTNNDYNQPVFYINGEELDEFIKSSRISAKGYGYEWENEKVCHIHFSPLKHSFGIQHKVSIVKSGNEHIEDATLKIDIKEDGTVKTGDIDVNIIPSKENLYCRNKGLLEIDILSQKRVLIIGLGSGGSPIAVELAKAGVGQFVLADFDRVELHNLSRHICTVNDLGRLKTDAVSEAIKGKNPYALVEKLPIDINKNLDILEEEISKADLVLCCTDNNSSRFNTSELLIKQNKTGLFGRAITRAEGGDVFIYRPGDACYFCLIGNNWYDQNNEEITNLESAKRSGRLPAYVSEEDAEAFVQVGLGADIEPINNMMVKLALVELSRGSNSGISSLEEEFKYNYYFWVNRRERQYKNWGSFTNTDCMPTIMKWYGVNIEKEYDCKVCNAEEALKLNMETLQSLNIIDTSNLKDISLSDFNL